MTTERTLFDEYDIDPAAVLPADIAAVLDAKDLKPAVTDDAFFSPGTTYVHNSWSGREVFHCASLARAADGRLFALGYVPVRIGERSTWEMQFVGRREFDGCEWVIDPSAAPAGL